MLSLLTECTILMIRIIHDMYREQRITYDELCSLAKLKIEYLYQNLDRFTLTEKQEAVNILDEHKKLLVRESYQKAYNLFYKSADLIQ